MCVYVYVYVHLFKHTNQLIFTEFGMGMMPLVATPSYFLISYGQYTVLEQMDAQTSEVDATLPPLSSGS
jgi:hypothetical protein